MKIPVAQHYGTPANVFHHKVSPSTSLALRFHQKWMALHPQDTCNSGGNLDDSLTSLGWLQNLKVSEFTQPSAGPNSNINFFKQEPQSPTPNIMSLQTTMLEPRLQVGDTAPSGGSFRASFDYKSNPYVKPPYSYTSLICMAMQATKKSKITLSCIYNWIKENFVYYRLTDPSWQNSIRHNLSLNKCFEKVARQKDEPGKGGFWRINPEYGTLVEKGIIKKRRGSWDPILSPPLKRFKPKEDNVPRVSGMKSNARDDKLLSNSFRDHMIDDDENSLTLKNDLDWLSVFNQDIKFSDSTVNARDIQDDIDNSPFLAMSPPSSETNSDDLGLELFSQMDFAMGFPTDFQTNDPLDLTVQGTIIKPPEWWSTDGTSIYLNVNNKYDTTSSLNTPTHLSTAAEQRDSIWGEGLELDSNGNNFGLDTLFEFDSIQNQK